MLRKIFSSLNIEIFDDLLSATNEFVTREFQFQVADTSCFTQSGHFSLPPLHVLLSYKLFELSIRSNITNLHD